MDEPETVCVPNQPAISLSSPPTGQSSQAIYLAVEDVINGLENMRLTTEEEGLITISDEGQKEEIESYSLSLLGKFLTCKPFNKWAA
ncbi:hypothetical protein CFP56_039458 [Quercus suber]|uniref:Uncharacterized protein n=1 Tax=Quercus suber TaxID=58331 RepID=A0AAW0J026_QUESU